MKDIIAELKKPGRDPRASFIATAFREDVTTLQDLQVGMTLSGVVTNVAAFGAFVDIGVHQDGLVHISQLADCFVKDPHALVQVGQQVQVRVLEVDERRKRISLTMRSAAAAEKEKSQATQRIDGRAKKRQEQRPAGKTDLAQALERSGFRVKR